MNGSKGNQEVSESDSNSIKIRIDQIKSHGQITVKHDDIKVFFEFTSNTSAFVEQTTKYEREMTNDELDSLDSAINLIQGQNENELFTNFQKCYKIAKELQKSIQILYKFGKNYVYESHPFFDEESYKGTKANLETLIHSYKKQYQTNDSFDFKDIKYPPFLSLDNLLYFGSLLQKESYEELTNKKNKFLPILQSMFSGISEMENNLLKKQTNQEKVTLLTIIKEANKPENGYIVDPLKCSIYMFSLIFNSIPKKNSSNNKVPTLNKEQKELQSKLTDYFNSHNFLVLKVNITAECFHVLRAVSTLLSNQIRRTFFYEYFYCFEDSDIKSYFDSFTDDLFKISLPYFFIVHPEFLSSHNLNVLKEKIQSRMQPVPDTSLQKFVVITASNDFDFALDENPFNLDIDLMRSSSFFRDTSFKIKIFQSKSAGNGKSSFIEKVIQEDISKSDNPGNCHTYEHFIVDANQPIPIKSFLQEGDKFIHLQFSDEIMSTGIKFWSYLNQFYFDYYILPPNGEPFCTELVNSNVYFEIPQIQGREEDFPLKNLNEFPIPLKIDEGKIYNIEENAFEKPEMINKYSQAGFKVLFDRIDYNKLDKKPYNISNTKDIDYKAMKKYLYIIYSNVFDTEELPTNVSLRKLSFVEKYLNKFTSLYLNSVGKTKINTNSDEFFDEFAYFFLLLVLSSFYEYNILPNSETSKIGKVKKVKGLVLLTVKDLFCDQTFDTQRIEFFLTEDESSLKKKLKFNEIKTNTFKATFNFRENNEAEFQKILRQIFCSSKEYEEIVQEHSNSKPNGYISRTKMTLSTLFRATIILNRIYLSQSIIMRGDTGCGKTSTLGLIFEYFSLPYNREMYSLNIEVANTLNCHGGVDIEDVDEHIKNAPRSSKKHIVFFDELNTSPASSYIEHLLLKTGSKRGGTKFSFIGALNPLVEKNPISNVLTKVGLKQVIKGEEKKCNLLFNNNKEQSSKNMADMMYHVHPPQKSTEDIIYDFNPIFFDGPDNEPFYPEEEKNSMHSIIKSKAKNNDAGKLQEYIDKCIVFIRTVMNERAVISYRDIERTMRIYEYLFSKYPKSTDLPIITVISSFVLRLPNNQKVSENDLGDAKDQFKNIYNQYFGDDNGSKNGNDYVVNLHDKLLLLLSNNATDIKKEDRIKELKEKFVKFTYQYNIEILKDPNVWKFDSTSIHLFIMDVCIHCKLPCFVIGMPGTSKSYAVELLKEHYKDKLYLSVYMSSRTSSPDGIKSQYYDAIYQKIIDKKNHINDRLYAVFIDEMGNANINPSRPLKFLHGILDHGLVLNETGHSKKVATIGVSNYTMDFANMNRGVLVYTGLPSYDELVKVFAYDKCPNKPKITDGISLFEAKKNNNFEKTKEIFNNLWGSEKNMPETIALRSIYSIQSLIDEDNKDKLTPHVVCRICRELFNSKRLGDTMDEYKKLNSSIPGNIQNIIKEKYPGLCDGLDNLVCFLERISDTDTASNKSLSIFTKNYEAIEYFDLFKEKGFIEHIKKNMEYQPSDDNLKININDDPKCFESFKHIIFAEDFKEKPETLSQDALKIIIERISQNKNDNNKRILFVGNHPCFDSCLDLLNVPHNINDINDREVTLGSGFSSKFTMKDKKFFICMIANIEDLKNISKQDNPFSFAFLDRTETLYIDWSIISKYYIPYITEEKLKIQNVSFDENEYKKLLKSLSLYESENPPCDLYESLHTNISDLYESYDKDLFNKIISKEEKDPSKTTSTILLKLIEYRWKNGIKAVILTKSKILEELYIPSKFKKNHEVCVEEIDSNIQNFEELKLKVEAINKDNTEILIIIKLSKFDSLHFAHLKSFFDQISNSKKDIKFNVFLVYYGCNPDDFNKLSTFRWPILAMEDISILKGLEKSQKPISNKDFYKLIDVLNNMNEGKGLEDKGLEGQCITLFKDLIKQIIEFVKKEVMDKDIENKDYKDCIGDRIEKFLKTNLYNEIGANVSSFHINPDNVISKERKNMLSKRAYVISAVYQVLCKELKPMIVFSFFSKFLSNDKGKLKLDQVFNYLTSSKYLRPCFDDLLKNSQASDDPGFFLFSGYTEFLADNSVSFDDNIKKKKCVVDKIFENIFNADDIKPIIELVFYNNNLLFSDDSIKKCIRSTSDLSEFKFEEDDQNNGNKTKFSYQTFLDYSRLRMFAGISLKNYEKEDLWSKYFVYSIFINNKFESKVTNFEQIRKRVIHLRNIELSSIFKSPFVNDMGYDNHIFNICQTLFSSDTENKEEKFGLENDKLNKLFKFNLKEDDPFSIAQQKFKDKPDDGYKWSEFSHKDTKLIDSYQAICYHGYNTKSEFRESILHGFELDEPLSLVALRKCVNEPDSKQILANIVDPFSGDENFAKLFAQYVNDSETFAKDSKVMGNIKFTTIFKYTENEIIYYDVEKPSLAQLVWFHTSFNKPSEFPYITKLIKWTPFFIDFHCVPTIINSILHLRHKLSYNPVIIPIILYCTSLFPSDAYPLSLFDEFKENVRRDDNKTIYIMHEFAHLKGELNQFKDYLSKSKKYSEKFKEVENKSAYCQIQFVLDIYFEEYNKFVDELYNSLSFPKDVDKCDLIEIEQFSILPNMLINNFTLFNVALPIINQTTDFSIINESIMKIFTSSFFAKYDPQKEHPEELPEEVCYQFFKVKVTASDDKRDFLGYNKSDYKFLFNSFLPFVPKAPQADNKPSRLEIHKSILSFLIFKYQKHPDRIQGYDNPSKRNQNNNNNDNDEDNFENARLDIYLDDNDNENNHNNKISINNCFYSKLVTGKAQDHGNELTYENNGIKNNFPDLLEKIFNVLDTNDVGSLDYNGLVQFYSLAQCGMTDEQVRNQIETKDSDHDGRLTFDQATDL